jgi:hypothetical protein
LLVAATAITPEQLAGDCVVEVALLLPAATTTTAPLARAELMAFCVVISHAPVPPSDTLITLAGLALTGTPVMVLPAAHAIESATSEL